MHHWSVKTLPQCSTVHTVAYNPAPLYEDDKWMIVLVALGLSLDTILARGSMVLSLFCVSFFAPYGAKDDTQAMKHTSQAKALCIHYPAPADLGLCALAALDRPLLISRWVYVCVGGASALDRGALVCHNARANNE
jgi:hypothetical protein